MVLMRLVYGKLRRWWEACLGSCGGWLRKVLLLELVAYAFEMSQLLRTGMMSVNGEYRVLV
jgi:hypothetical protein